jgi:hypothetical protein
MHQRSVIINIICQSKKSELKDKLCCFHYRDGPDGHLDNGEFAGELGEWWGGAVIG